MLVILRPGKTPSGVEVRKLLSRLIGRIRRHWGDTRITIRGDGHYGRTEVMTWCESNGIDYIFGLPGNVVLDYHYGDADAVAAAFAQAAHVTRLEIVSNRVVVNALEPRWTGATTTC